MNLLEKLEAILGGVDLIETGEDILAMVSEMASFVAAISTGNIAGAITEGEHLIGKLGEILEDLKLSEG